MPTVLQITLNAPTPGSQALEELINARNPNWIWTVQETSGSFAVSTGTAGTGGALGTHPMQTFNGATLGNPGWGGSVSAQFTGNVDQRLYSAGVPFNSFDFTQGFVMAMFKCDAPNASSEGIFGFANNFGANQFLLYHNDQGNLIVDVTDGGFSQRHYRSQCEQADVDILDGNWHMVFARQAADGNGIVWNVDGNQYDATDPVVNENTFVSGDVDMWFIDPATAVTGIANATSIGSDATNAGTFQPFNGNINYVVVDDTNISDADALAWWNSTGL